MLRVGSWTRARDYAGQLSVVRPDSAKVRSLSQCATSESLLAAGSAFAFHAIGAGALAPREVHAPGGCGLADGEDRAGARQTVPKLAGRSFAQVALACPLFAVGVVHPVDRERVAVALLGLGCGRAFEQATVAERQPAKHAGAETVERRAQRPDGAETDRPGAFRERERVEPDFAGGRTVVAVADAWRPVPVAVIGQPFAQFGDGPKLAVAGAFEVGELASDWPASCSTSCARPVGEAGRRRCRKCRRAGSGWAPRPRARTDRASSGWRHRYCPLSRRRRSRFVLSSRCWHGFEALGWQA